MPPSSRNEDSLPGVLERGVTNQLTVAARAAALTSESYWIPLEIASVTTRTRSPSGTNRVSKPIASVMRST